jgi:DNA-binding transcriptional LysR family regulator
MDLNWLQDFVCLARTLNFTRAAEERNITQSAFSRRIKSLEIWAGTPLIDRTSYPAKLSTAGELFLPVAKQILLQLLQTRDDLRSYDSGGRRFYGFAATHSISINHLASYVRILEQADPPIRTRVMSDNLHACCQLLSEGACEFLLCYRHPHITLALDEQSFARIDLGTECLVPVAAAGGEEHPPWHLPGTRSAPIPHLAYAKGSFLGAVVDHILHGRRAALDVRHMDAFAEALKSLTLQGAGVAWLPERSVARALAAGDLILAGDREWTSELTLSLFAAPDRLDRSGTRIWNFFLDIAA